MNVDDLRVSEHPILVRDRALQRLRAAIVNGVYKPGDRLIDRELGERMGISRASVREVVRQLETEGLVQVEPRRGLVVATITPQDALDIYEFRAMLEEKAVRLFVERAGPAQRAALKASTEAFAAAGAAGRLNDMIEAMSEFYGTLFKGAGNHVFENVGTRLLTRISALRRLSMSKPGRVAKSVVEMRELTDAVLAGDVQRAADACARHIEAAREAAMALMREGRQDDTP